MEHKRKNYPTLYYSITANGNDPNSYTKGASIAYVSSTENANAYQNLRRLTTKNGVTFEDSYISWDYCLLMPTTQTAPGFKIKSPYMKDSFMILSPNGAIESDTQMYKNRVANYTTGSRTIHYSLRKATGIFAGAKQASVEYIDNPIRQRIITFT